MCGDVVHTLVVSTGACWRQQQVPSWYCMSDTAGIGLHEVVGEWVVGSVRYNSTRSLEVCKDGRGGA